MNVILHSMFLYVDFLWSEQQHRIAQPKTRTKKYGDRAFSTCAPKCWNELPQAIKYAESVRQFQNSFEDICLNLLTMCDCYIFTFNITMFSVLDCFVSLFTNIPVVKLISL